MANNIAFQLLLTPRAARDLKKLDFQILKRLDKAILELAHCPYSPGVRKLTASDIAQYRIRVGDYRILYDIDESAKSVVILRVGHRRDIYR